MAENPICVQEIEKKVKMDLETIYKDKELNVETLTKILNIPKRDVQNILGVESQ
jgi:hypothetical protein